MAKKAFINHTFPLGLTVTFKAVNVVDISGYSAELEKSAPQPPMRTVVYAGNLPVEEVNKDDPTYVDAYNNFLVWKLKQLMRRIVDLGLVTSTEAVLERLAELNRNQQKEEPQLDIPAEMLTADGVWDYQRKYTMVAEGIAEPTENDMRCALIESQFSDPSEYGEFVTRMMGVTVPTADGVENSKSKVQSDG